MDATGTRRSDDVTRRAADKDGTAAPRAWQRMLSGRRLDLLDPSPLDIEIADIAHGLARVARWNGQTQGVHALSVAQHCLLVEDITQALHGGWSRVWRRAALLHDAAEYVIGDLISPFKAAVGLDYKAFEVRLMSAIHRRFDVPDPLPVDIAQAIKAADHAAAYFEATVLAGFSKDEAGRFFGVPKLPMPLTRTLGALAPQAVQDAQARYLARFKVLAD
jgi:uncharacterized protein